MDCYPKRLIEVDLPIKRISAHARREKSIRHGHISTLHIWWARRPLAACRAVICASLWPDPVDPDCPADFRDKARMEMQKWTTHDHQALLSAESRERFEKARQKPSLFKDTVQLRGALLDFIADFANWDNSTAKEFLDTSRLLTQAAHEALGGATGTKPLVVDPFAGGGSIPLEALRVGADAFASDLNPVAVLLNKVVLEYVPKYGQRLADEVHKWGEWIKKEAEKELAEFYPKDPDGATPIAYLWARTIQCEGPGCGAEVPLMRSLMLVNKSNSKIGVRMVPRRNRSGVDFELVTNTRQGTISDGTVRRGSATCQCCGYTTSAENVRKQFAGRRGGASDARLVAVVTSIEARTGRSYRLAGVNDLASIQKATEMLRKISQNSTDRDMSFVPNEELPYLRSIFNINILDVNEWGDLFPPRQAFALGTFAKHIRRIEGLAKESNEPDLASAIQTVVALAFSRAINRNCSLARWDTTREGIGAVFSRQALPIMWEFAEANPISSSTGSISSSLDEVVEVLKPVNAYAGIAQVASAANHPLSNNSAELMFTDPPYYDAVPYADLSDFFYVWLRRSLGSHDISEFVTPLSPKQGEIVQLAERNKKYAYKTREYFERLMTKAMAEGRRIVAPGGMGVVVFAHKQTSAWETQLQSMIDAGWTVTGSWPIDTEMGNRMRAQNSAALGSSVHLICRPRENLDGSVRADEVGDWRDVLTKLPRRIHEWMPRLAEEGVVGADAIFACLGPALEIFSRYSRVEKAGGEAVTLREYLEQVWAAVAKEALIMIFTGADATGFEEDARLTAMWMWTLKTGETNGEGETEEEDDADEEGGEKKVKAGGFVLEYDAARKIAQGLGAHLDRLTTVVEIKGETARLLSVGERATHLFGKESSGPKERPRKKKAQPSLFVAMDEVQEEVKEWEIKAGKIGETILDRLHQSMILFGAGRGEALRRFLVEDGAGRDQRLWRLAQAFSALYPTGTDEKRWVDGVLARKKGLGL